MMDWNDVDLPVAAILPELTGALEKHRRAVLAAAPGAGKTTLAPPWLLEHLPLDGGNIVMLEPRRIAARAAAARIAALLGERVGETVGYRVRGESCVSAKTRIEVVTEGMLTRMMQRDPELNGIGLLIFDEFHERNLNSDLGLALALDIGEGLREDLAILVMSATLETERVAALLGNAPIVESEGRMYPVAEHWGEPFGELRDLPGRMANAVRNVAASEPGSILVFLPGAREIEQTAQLLRDLDFASLHVVPLYGNLDKKAQDAAIAPPRAGERKIVLSTNIAESSLTIEGVRVVVDSGCERVLRFDPATGMSGLETIHISRASAAQRAGRAGRLGPGAVYRLWTEPEHRRLAEQSVPEILEADLANFVLELAAWGTDAGQLCWLDAPPAAQLATAQALLRDLGALDDVGRLTGEGRRLADLPVHPRVGRMLLEAQKRDLLPLGCELAALAEERDPAPRLPGADIGERLHVWRTRPRDFYQGGVIRDQLLRMMHCTYREQSEASAGLLLAFAYPDWIARSRGVPGIQYLLSGGRGALLRESDDLRRMEYLAVARLDGAGNNAMIRLAAPLDEAELLREFSTRLTVRTRVEFDRAKQRVVGCRETMLGALALKTQPAESALTPEAVLPVLADAVRQAGLQVLEITGAAQNLLERVRFAAVAMPEWELPDWTENGLAANLETLLQQVPEVRSFADLRKVDWLTIFRNELGYQNVSRLDREFPERCEVPTGSKIKIDYAGEVPVLAVRVQELYGMKKHPTLGAGRLPLKLELLSPAHRTIQITSDLAGFWATNWQLVRKEMRAEYPKHVWPENPADAEPTTRAKPRKK